MQTMQIANYTDQHIKCQLQLYEEVSLICLSFESGQQGETAECSLGCVCDSTDGYYTNVDRIHRVITLTANMLTQ